MPNLTTIIDEVLRLEEKMREAMRPINNGDTWFIADHLGRGRLGKLTPDEIKIAQGVADDRRKKAMRVLTESRLARALKAALGVVEAARALTGTAHKVGGNFIWYNIGADEGLVDALAAFDKETADGAL